MKWATLSLLGLMVTPMEAKVWMPKMFQDGMVLQRGKPMAIWGTADPKELVTVRKAIRPLPTRRGSGASPFLQQRLEDLMP